MTKLLKGTPCSKNIRNKAVSPFQTSGHRSKKKKWNNSTQHRSSERQIYWIWSTELKSIVIIYPPTWNVSIQISVNLGDQSRWKRWTSSPSPQKRLTHSGQRPWNKIVFLKPIQVKRTALRDKAPRSKPNVADHIEFFYVVKFIVELLSCFSSDGLAMT